MVSTKRSSFQRGYVCHDVPTWKKDLVGKDAFANLTEIIQISEAQKVSREMAKTSTFLKLERMRDILAPKWDLNYLKKSVMERSEKMKTFFGYTNKIAQLDCFNDRLAVTRT